MSWPNGIPDVCPNPVNDFDCPLFAYVGEENSFYCKGHPGKNCPNQFRDEKAIATNCPTCNNKGVPIVYGYIEDDPEDNPRVYRAGCVPDSFFNEKMELPIRHCYRCNIDFYYTDDVTAFAICYEEVMSGRYP